MDSASEVALTIPAEPSHVGLARAATSAVCAQADFPVDRLDDLRLAVDEACALVIADAPPDSQLHLRLAVSGSHVSIEVRGTSRKGLPVATNTFAWTVLTALVDDVQTSVEAGQLCIRLQADGVGSVAL